ncbi:MAG: hypothetical protein H6622_15925 [Halobacteriovoraceae bacterium]|nr:hypothetical protein [Halobacteriovoraceae bacterium]
MNNKKSVYYYNLLKSHEIEFNKNYSYLITRILNVQSMYTIGNLELENVSKEILDAFNKNESFVGIDRICLCISDDFSKKLSVISSANSLKLTENKMMARYQCYVAHESSLYNLSQGDFRSYSDIDQILKTYDENSKPSQKSLIRLKEMGVKSGLTLRFKIDESHSGFIFLNSSHTQVFNVLDDEFFSMLYLLKSVVMLIILESIYKNEKYLNITDFFVNDRLLTRSKVNFDIIMNAIQEYYNFHYSETKIKGIGSLNISALNSNNILLKELFHLIDLNPNLLNLTQLEVELSIVANKLKIEIRYEEKIKLYISKHTLGKRFFGVHLSIEENGFVLSIPIEISKKEMFPYSVE